VGGEFSLFDRLRLDLGYYHRIASDQIISQQISNASGFGSRRVNIGETMNQGVEALVDATLVRSEGFNWNTTVNVNYNTSEVIDLGQDLGITEIQVGTADFHGSLRQVQGMPMNQLYGRAYLRDEQGRLIHDENGVPIAGNQQIPLGDALPKWIGGITNSFDIRGVSVSALIDFKLGHKLISGTHTNAVRHGLDKSTLEGRDQGCIVGEGVNEAGEVNTVCTPIQQYYEAIRTYQVAAQSLFNAGF